MLRLFDVRSYESNEPRTLARLEAFPLLSKLSYLNAPGEGAGAVGIGFVSLLTAVCMPSGRGETTHAPIEAEDTVRRPLRYCTFAFPRRHEQTL